MTKNRITDEERKTLLELARSAIGSTLGKDQIIKRPKNISRGLAQKRGCFVTLHKGDALRGCMGNIESSRSLIEGIEKNALNAAFNDFRFKKLTAEELRGVNIEISALTVPEIVEFKGHKQLFSKIKPGVHGVVISKGERGATFLPQVWKQLPGKEEFFGALCRKAGLEPLCWKDPGIEVKVYEAEYFLEPAPLA